MRIVLGIIALLAILFIILKITFSEDIPTGVPGEPADELALKVLEAVHHEEFEKAERIAWTFRDKNHYEWFPQRGLAQVKWDDMLVELKLENPDNSSAFKNGVPLEGSKKAEAIDYAVKNFNNDSFWLVASQKIMDQGTEREVVRADAQEKLLVRYTSGGSTPGDVYLWNLDRNYRPQSFKMWVSIIPFDGIEAKLDNWEMTDAGFPMAKSKSVFGLEIPISNIQIQ